MRGLDFVAIDPHVAADVRIVALAKALKKDRFWIVGHLPAFFGSVAMNTPDGDLSLVDDELLDAWAGGVSGFGKAVREHLCNEDGVLRAWSRYNGRALRNLERDRHRKAERRARAHGTSPDGPRNVRGMSAESPRNVPGMSADVPRTIQIQIQKQIQKPLFLTEEKKKKQGGDGDGEVHARVDGYLAGVPHALRETVAGALRSHGNPEALVRSLEAIESGMTPPAYDRATIAQALQDMAVAEVGISVRAIRGFCRKLVEPAPLAKAVGDGVTTWNIPRLGEEDA